MQKGELIGTLDPSYVDWARVYQDIGGLFVASQGQAGGGLPSSRFRGEVIREMEASIDGLRRLLASVQAL